MLPPGVEVAIQRQAGRHRRCGARRDRADSRSRARDRALGRPSADRRGLPRGAGGSITATRARRRRVTTRELDEPGQYGRIVRGPDGEVERIVETKAPGDATRRSWRSGRSTSGRMPSRWGRCSRRSSRFAPTTPRASSTSATCSRSLRARRPQGRCPPDRERALRASASTRGPTWRRCSAICRSDILRRHMLAGVTITDPASTLIEVDVRIGEDTVIEPYTVLRGQVEIGAGCSVGPMTTLTDCVARRGRGCRPFLSGGLRGARSGCTVGPFAYIRPGTMLRERREGRARSSRSRTPTSERERRSRTCPTSATPTSASDRTSEPETSPPTTTARRSTAP